MDVSNNVGSVYPGIALSMKSFASRCDLGDFDY
jgi:hypothetical protein